MALDVIETRRRQWVRHSLRDITEALRYAVSLQAQGATVDTIAATLGVSTRTFLRWRAEYGGLTPDQIIYIDRLEREIARLRKIVSNLESMERRGLRLSR
ncbi:MAG: transposase [Hyphomonadaceae bacterium]